MVLALLPLLTLARAADDPLMEGCSLTDAKFVDAYNEALGVLHVDAKRSRVAADRAYRMQPGCAGAANLAISARLMLADESMFPLILKAEADHPTLSVFPAAHAQALFLSQRFEDSLAAGEHARALDSQSGEAAQVVLNALLRLGRYPQAETLVDSYPGIDAGARDCLRISIRVDQNIDSEGLRAACAATQDAMIREIALATLDAASGHHASAGAHESEAGIGTGVLEGTANELMRAQKWDDAKVLFQQLVDSQSWNALYHIQLATCELMTGEKARAKKELASLYAMDTWVTQHESGSMTGIVTKGSEEALHRALQAAFAQLVELQLERGDTEGAAEAQRRAEARFGRTAALAGSGALMHAATDGTEAGWSAMESALRSFPTEPALLASAGKFAFDHAEGLPAGVEAAIVASGGEADRTNVLSGLFNASLDARCVAFGQRVLPTMQGDARVRMASDVYICALRGRDLTTADAMFAADAAHFPVDAKVFHSALLLEANRATEALAMAEGLGDSVVKAFDVRVNALRALHRLDDAVALRDSAGISPGTRVNLAIDLYNAQRFDVARAVARDLDCSQLPEDPAGCKDFLKALSAAGP